MAVSIGRSVARPGISSWVVESGLRQPHRFLAITIVVWTAVRLVLAGTLGASFDEAYYIALARHVSLSYFDHPPVLMWLLAAAMKVTGSDSVFVLRSVIALLFVGTNWLMFKLTAELFDASAGAFAVLLLNLSILFSFGVGGWIMTEAPLMFFLLAASICVARIVFSVVDHPMWYWAFAGLFFGLALLSKYTAIMVMAGFFLFALSSRQYRGWLAQPGPYVAAALALVTFSPAVVWNWQHHWASFEFQGDRAFASAGISFIDFLKTILGQAGLIGPWVWAPLVVVFVMGLRHGTSNLKSWFLCCAAAPSVLFFTVISLWVPSAASHVHWGAAGYLFLFPLLGNEVADRLHEGMPLTRLWLLASIVEMLVCAVLFVSQATTGWGTTITVRILGRTVKDPTVQLVDWSELPPVLKRHGLLDRGHIFVAGTNRYVTSKLDTQLGKNFPIVCLCGDPRHFRYVWKPGSFRGWDALIVGPDLSLEDVSSEDGKHFATIAPFDSVDVRRGGRVVLTLKVYMAKDYNPA